MNNRRDTKQQESNSSMDPGRMARALSQAVGCQRFTGWSGAARAMGGALALITAVVLKLPGYPSEPIAQADGWGLLALAAFLIHAVALGLWYARLPRTQRHAHALIPVLHALMPLLVTCAISIAMIMRLEFQYLPGVWMCGYGLVNLSLHHVIPRGIRLVGLYYVLCGVLCLLVLPMLRINPILNPWPLGAVFFTGEIWGAAVLHLNRRAGSGPVAALATAGDA